MFYPNFLVIWHTQLTHIVYIILYHYIIFYYIILYHYILFNKVLATRITKCFWRRRFVKKFSWSLQPLL